MQLLITPLAAFDLEEIGDYIAQDNPFRAGTFVAELRGHCEKICLNPAGYRRRPERSPRPLPPATMSRRRLRLHPPHAHTA